MSEDTTKKTVGSSEVAGGKKPFTKQEAIAQALEMLESSPYLLVGTNSEDGFPNIKALNNRKKHEGLKTIWLRTDASSRKVQQMKKDNRACIYCLGQAGGGMMLVGTVEILNDPESKKMVWMPGEEKYYQRGIDDPEYTALRFTAIRANMVPADNKGLTFDIE